MSASKSKRSVHQFHSGSALGDAVTQSLFLTQRFLRELGFNSEIFVEHIGEGLEKQVRSFREYRDRGDTFLIHHSMGHDQIKWIESLSGAKILVYHNITPPEFFAEGSVARRYSVLGREQLKALGPQVKGAIADSELNAEELRQLGYSDVRVIPLLIDVERLAQEPWNSSLPTTPNDAFVVLFVGRVAENKCQHDLIEVMYHLDQLMSWPTQLVLVGHFDPRDSYYCRLKGLIESRGLGGRVVFAGKVAERDLVGWYRRANVLLCMSEHEGFGVPLVEAMTFDLPVLGYDSTSVAGTLGGAGLLLGTKNHREIAALIQILSKDRPLRRILLEGQRKRMAAFSAKTVRDQLAVELARVGLETKKLPSDPPSTAQPRLQIEGPFETTYSLALLNREAARALEAIEPGSVSLFPTEGPGDYSPKNADLARYPDLQPLWKRGFKGAMPEVNVRTLYPPRVHDADGLINLFAFAWEESIVPRPWVEQFNRHLDGCIAISQYVKKVLIDSGVVVPIAVIGLGTDHVTREPPDPTRRALGKPFRFLHVSSAFPRKGIDCLLDAYGQAFSGSDPVTLVLKTFPNIHNHVAEQLARHRQSSPDFPDVVFINEDLSQGELANLYRQCHAFVAPSRGEGFGLPLAEAMAFGLPVIASEGSGHADFCTDETSWLVPTVFAPSASHHGSSDSVWLEPSVPELTKRMLEVFRASPAEQRQRTRKAKELMQRDFTWSRYAEKTLSFVEYLQNRVPLAVPKLKVGWFSTWNAKCGVATYSSYLLRHFPKHEFDVTILASRNDELLGADDPNVIRCWEPLSQSLTELQDAILELGLHAVVFQFNFGFVRLPPFAKLLQTLRTRGIQVFVTLHSVKDVNKPHYKASLKQMVQELSQVERILVHSVSDLNALKQIGLVDNATLFPHGVFDVPGSERGVARAELGLPQDSKIIASYGFLLPNKGIEQLIEAFEVLCKDDANTYLLLVNAMYPGRLSQDVKGRCLELIEQRGLRDRALFITDFLREEESMALLRGADIVVFPYQSTAESVSGAVRFGLSSRRAVACTPVDIFSDVATITHTLPGTNPEALAQGIGQLLRDPALLESKRDGQAEWVKEHAWRVLATRLGCMIQGVFVNASQGRQTDSEVTGEPTARERQRLAN